MRDLKKRQTRVRPDTDTVPTVTRGRQTPLECQMPDCTNMIPRYGIICPKCYKKVHGIIEETPQAENA